MNRIDFTALRAVLAEIVDEVAALDGKEFDDRSGFGNTNSANLSRRLNRIADLCQVAESLVRSEYWSGKGFKDPSVE